MSDLQEVKNRILSKTPLESLIGEHVRLQKRAGRNMGCCPFHAEKTPSFYIYDDHYHCFGCGAHGDAISFVRHQQGLGFIETLKWLAQKYTISAPELEKSQKNLSKWQDSARKTRILMEAQSFFVESMKEAGEVASQYLSGRGFDRESQEISGFGYAPDQGDALIRHLGSLGFSLKEMEEASLANSYRGRSFDFFRHRVMIPIRDIQGRLIAFGGRALGDQQLQKYKNSRYDKGSVLFGLDHARKISRKKGRAIVVEGYLDALKMRMSGFPETVACQGTALTKEHLRSLKSSTPEVILLFDGDKAGKKASLKTLENALEVPEVRFKVAELPDGSDPDSYLEERGPEAMEELLAGSGELLSYCISGRLATAHKEAVPGLINQEILPWLLQVADPVQRSFLVEQISQISGVPGNVLRDALAGKRNIQTGQNSGPQSAAAAREASQAAPLPDDLESYIPAPLGPAAYELTGHLFYAEEWSGDLSRLVRQIIERDLEEDPLWFGFISEILACLEAGQIPAQKEDHSWTLSQSPHISNLTTLYRQSPQAFYCRDRKKIFQRLQLLIIKNKIENTIASTKSRMNGIIQSADSNADDLRDHANQLLRLRHKLREVCTDLSRI